ncbi:MAG: FAD-binding protein [Desulfobacteraceae bacterium]|nr:MAG: FAD-binding protein [Desulfobacteraceae bacterium]
MPPYAFQPVTQRIIEELSGICGREHVTADDAAAMRKYAHDQVPGEKYAHMPDVVVRPRTAREIAAIVRLANREHIPVTPRAAGSGLSGGAVAAYGGILLSVERMNQVLEIDVANLMAVVEPGVITNQLDKALRPHGLFFAGYPMSDEFCFVGGNVAENAGGGRAIKYGVTGRYIHGLETVTPTGEIVQLGGKRVKDVTGYDLVHLMVGSEGTLGIFTKIYIRLLPRPTARVAILALFEEVSDAIAVVPRVVTAGRLVPSAVEFMDRFCYANTVALIRESFPTQAIGAALLLEVDGNRPEVVAAEADIIRGICAELGAKAEFIARDESEIERFWKIRKQIPWMLRRTSQVQSVEDIVVPIAAIPQLLPELDRIGQSFDTLIPVFGHAGDGNLHATPMKNAAHHPAQWEETLTALLTEIYAVTARLGGTISGEHGIGHKRRDYMPLVMESAQIDMMRRIKQALDPNNVINPGKIFVLE